jgi:hypothetical protein
MDTTLIPRQSLTGYQAGRRLTRLLSSTPAFGSPARRTWRCPHVMARPAPGRNQRAAKTTRTPNCGRTRDAQNRTICALAPPQPVSPPTAPNRSVSVPVLRAGGIAPLGNAHDQLGLNTDGRIANAGFRAGFLTGLGSSVSAYHPAGICAGQPRHDSGGDRRHRHGADGHTRSASRTRFAREAAASADIPALAPLFDGHVARTRPGYGLGATTNLFPAPEALRCPSHLQEQR